jgi:hypothetical protein
MAKQELKPVIVVVAYNRVHSLKRILRSMNNALVPDGTKLIISIDNNGQNQDVVAVAEEYNWVNGEKEVIYQNKRMGLRNHILLCGDLCTQYGSAILVEEDLVVSPYFYKFSKEALEYYENANEIAGISLYSLPYTEASKVPFIPLIDNSDVNFQQVPCSLGMAYTRNQWESFKKWYNLNPDVKEIKGLPIIVTKYWSESSWKKFMYGYMVTQDKYFVYPNNSLTSNFNDHGENMITKSYSGQVGLQIVSRNYNFKSLSDSINVYDAYSEILADRLKMFCPLLDEFDFEVDLYGQREFFTKDYVLTSKKCKSIIKGFERTMKPAELNIIYNLPGNDIKLAKRDDVILNLNHEDYLLYNSKNIKTFIKDYSYYYRNVFDTKILWDILKFRIVSKLKKKLGLNI